MNLATLAGIVARVVAVLAAGGIALTAVAFVSAAAGHPLLGDAKVECLFVGIFVVWFPTVLLMTRMTRSARQRDIWKSALSGCPTWMQRSFYGIFAAGMLYFVWYNLTGKDRAGEPTIYFAVGHLLIFYTAAFAVAYSAIKKPELLGVRRCINGHEVSQIDGFCPVCGTKL